MNKVVHPRPGCKMREEEGHNGAIGDKYELGFPWRRDVVFLEQEFWDFGLTIYMS